MIHWGNTGNKRKKHKLDFIRIKGIVHQRSLSKERKETLGTGGNAGKWPLPRDRPARHPKTPRRPGGGLGTTSAETDTDRSQQEATWHAHPDRTLKRGK